ncbi:hypothetical protein VPHD518_0021 [Vibrio phage D518]
MGLFSKKKTFVGASTVSLIEDTPDMVGTTISTALLKGRDFAPDLIGNYLNGIYINSNRYYSYGRDTYTYGLPDGSHENLKTQDYILKPIIEKEVGFKITIVSSKLDKCDGTSMAYPWITDNRGWDYETNICAEHPFTNIFGSPITVPVYFDYAETTDIDEITLQYSYTENETTTYVRETIALDNVYPGEYYHHVIYIEHGTTEPRYYWNYRVNDGTYPELDVAPSIDLQSPYYPVVPVREFNKDLTADKETELYKTSKYLLNIIGLNIDDVATGINENPDVDDIDHAYVIMGIDILSEKEQSIRYLHDYFDNLHDLSPYTLSAYTTYLEGREDSDDTTPPPTQVITIKDANYHIDLAYSYTRSDIITGSIGKIGHCVRQDNVRPVHEGQGYNAEESSIIFRRQLTENTYSEVEVYGLQHVNHIYKQYTVNTSIGDAYEEDSQGDRINMNFVVPLNYAVVRNMGLAKANELMYDSLKMVFNSVETVKLKWYQTGFFKFVAIIVAVAVTIYTSGAGTGLTESLVGGAVTVGAVTLPLIVTDIVLAIAINQGFMAVAEVVGAEIAFAAAIILSCYGVASVLGTGSNAGLPFASEALMVANGLTDAATKIGYEELAIEQEAFQLEAEAKVAELEENMAELENKHELDPVDIFTDFGDDYYFQTPTDYIYTSVHAGNIGVTTLDGPRNYVETTLSLPSLSNSLGVNINV